MPEAKVLDELYIQRVEKRDTLQKGAAAAHCRRSGVSEANRAAGPALRPEIVCRQRRF